jgi:hypothetical protein
MKLKWVRTCLLFFILMGVVIHFANSLRNAIRPNHHYTYFETAKEYVMNPALVIQHAWEFKGLQDLALINNAAVRYYEKNRFFPVKIRQLTLDGFLSPSYENGKRSKYRFYFSNMTQRPDDFQLHADPIDPTLGLRHFYVGSDAVIREAADRPATSSSKAL